MSVEERQRRQDDLDDRGIEHQTCVYLIEQGIENIGMGKSFLLAEAARLADRYGDPRGFFRPAAQSPEHKVKTGRNDPCPCGSGKKYKRCCISKTSE
jgi:preprotein translocase subunit SecA